MKTKLRISFIIALLIIPSFLAKKTEYVSLNNCFLSDKRAEIIIPRTYGAVINCLAQAESSGNPNAIGRAGEIGVLQYMPSTWEMYCEDKYGLTDIWSAEQQMDCCNKMLRDNPNNIYQWSTYKVCENISALNVQGRY